MNGDGGGLEPASVSATGRPTLAEVLRLSTEHLAARGSETPRLDAERLLAKATGLERIELYMQLDRPLTPDELDAARELVARRARREPLQYVLGEWGFRRLTLTVDPRALIPRPETEILVERALALVAGQRAAARARRRHRLGRDRARDRRRAPRRGRDGDRQLGGRAGARGRERRAHGARGRARAGTTSSTACRPAHGTSSSRIRRTSPRATWPTLEPEVRDWEPHGRRSRPKGRSRRSRAARPERARAAAARSRSRWGRARRRRRRACSTELGFVEVGITPDLTGIDRVVEGSGAVSRRPSDAVRALRGGELVVLPTDTVYGLACTAVGRAAGGRPLPAQGPRRDPADGGALRRRRRRCSTLVPELGDGRQPASRAVLPGPVHARAAEPGAVASPGSTPPARRRSACGCRCSPAATAEIVGAARGGRRDEREPARASPTRAGSSDVPRADPATASPPPSTAGSCRARRRP